MQITLEVFNSAVHIIDTMSGTASLSRPVERECRSVIAIMSRRVDTYERHCRVESMTAGERFATAVNDVMPYLVPDGTMLCQTRKGVRPVRDSERIASELNSIGLFWVQPAHITAAQRALKEVKCR